MKPRIRNQKDFAAGIIYMVLGTGFAAGALNYKVGEAARMGPGYFPLGVGVLLAAVGAILVVLALKPAATPEKIQLPEAGPLAWVLGGVVLFGLLLQSAGLVLALTALVVVSSKGSHEFKWREVIPTAIVLILFSLAVFIWGINLQLPLWPAFLN